MTEQGLMQAYIPIDRVLALANGQELPLDTHGTGLFADISGFTPLTEALRRVYGDELGVEKLIETLNQVLDALISDVHRYGGSIIGFAGDAMTCWFDAARLGGEQAAALQALTTALSMQQAMLSFADIALPDGSSIPLQMKAALASGQARRFVVGNPQIQLIDVLAGDPLVRLASGEHIAGRGETVLDSPCYDLLADRVTVQEWRENDGERFALIEQLNTPAAPMAWGTLPRLDDALVRQWLLPSVTTYFDAGFTDFLTELRPIVALFLRFDGIDYAHDPHAMGKLDAFVREMQGVITQYQGNLIQLTVGDKGSYAYAAFGAPIAHENDVERALSAALQLQRLPTAANLTLQIGISRGTARTGAYGSAARRTYGVQGDEVNLSARLMAKAEAGVILVNDTVRERAQDSFVYETLEPVTLKGKSLPVAISRLLNASDNVKIGHYLDVMIGRDDDLRRLLNGIKQIAQRGTAGLFKIYGEAGIGKSRLITEVYRYIRRQMPLTWISISGDDMLQQPLQPFTHWLRQYFGQNQQASVDENHARFEETYADIFALPYLEADVANDLRNTQPFIAGLLGLPVQSDQYDLLDAKLRYDNAKIGIRALLYLLYTQQTVVLHVEDGHWLDNLSRELVGDLLWDAREERFAVISTSREVDNPQVTVAPAVTVDELDLAYLSLAGVSSIAEHMLRGAIAPEFAAQIYEKTRGNPFFVEQVVLDLLQRGLLTLSLDRWTIYGKFDEHIPDDLHSLLVARIDRLPVAVKSIVQTASVLGQRFNLEILARMLNDSTTLSYVETAEHAAIWSIISDFEYSFNHALLREAAYHMQVETHRRVIHRSAAETIEALYPEDEQQAQTLYYHWRNTDNLDKHMHYAKVALQQRYAVSENQVALEIINETLPFAAGTSEEAFFLNHKGDLRYRAGKLDDARSIYKQAFAIAQSAADYRTQAATLNGISIIDYQTGRREHVYRDSGLALEIAREINEIKLITSALSNRGLFKAYDGDLVGARADLEENVAIAREHNNTGIMALGLLNLGWLAFREDDIPQAQEHYHESLRLATEINARQIMTWALTNLASNYAEMGDFTQAQRYFADGLAIAQRIGNRLGIANALQGYADFMVLADDDLSAYDHYEAALQIFTDLKAGAKVATCQIALGLLSIKQNALARAKQYLHKGLEQAITLDDKALQFMALLGQPLLAAANDDWERSAELTGLLQHYAANNQISHSHFLTKQQQDLQQQLSPDILNAATERGAILDYAQLNDDFVHWLRAE